MHELRVAVICPMAIEREAVEVELRRAGFAPPRERASGPKWEYARGGVSVSLVQCGIGKVAVVAAVEGLAAGRAEDAPALVILAGAAGGLAAGAEVPEIARIVTEDPAFPGWVPSTAKNERSGAAVTLVGVDRVIATPAQKRALGAATGAAVVDMESHAFAAACERLGLMWGVVRGVSDTPDETLPGIVVNWLDPAGNTRTWRAARDLAVRPWLVPHMLKVMKRTNLVLPKVGAKVVELVEAAGSIRADADAARARAAGEGTVGGEKGWRGGAPITPLGLPGEVAVGSVVLVGGTFDPPHRAHVEMAAAARDAAAREGWLVFVPAARSPHKDVGPSASDADRVAMVSAAIDGVGRAIVWSEEIDRAAWEAAQKGAGGSGGASYFVETVRRARHDLDERAEGLGQARARLMFVIGADQAARFHLWHDARGIVDLAEPLVLPRGKVTTGTELRDVMAAARTGEGKAFWSDEECRWWGGRLVEMAVRDVSATSVRAALEAGTDASMLSEALDEKVARVIGERGLYR